MMQKRPMQGWASVNTDALHVHISHGHAREVDLNESLTLKVATRNADYAHKSSLIQIDHMVNHVQIIAPCTTPAIATCPPSCHHLRSH